MGCPRPIIGQHSQGGCVVYYSLQGYTDLIIRIAFAQQYRRFHLRSNFRVFACDDAWRKLLACGLTDPTGLSYWVLPLNP